MSCHKIYILLCVLGLLCTACTSDKKYRIGVSQCSADIWRDKQNAELRMGAYFHGNVELKFAAAYDSDERQVQQIDSLLATGIDLLIVAPNQVQTISPAIDRAYDSGIPVIVFERKTSSQKYTAFISADNYEMGRTMGEYIVSRLGGSGTVLEIKGLEGSSPAIERHKGFMDAIREREKCEVRSEKCEVRSEKCEVRSEKSEVRSEKSGGIRVVASLQGDWTEETAYEATLEWRKANPDVHVDLVFGANDRTAMGARRALTQTGLTQTALTPTSLTPDPSPKERGVYTSATDTSASKVYTPLPTREGQGGGSSFLFCGIDGLPGDDGGIQLVRDSLLDASYIYPTHGDQIIDLAVSILEGRPYEKETLLMSALVTRDNAKVLLMQSDELMRQADRLDLLHAKADNYLRELDVQHVVNWLALGIIILLVAVIVLFYLYNLRKVAMQREHVISTLWNISLTPDPSPKERGVYTSATDTSASTGDHSPLLGRGVGGEAFPKERGVYTSATDTSASTGDHSPLLGRGVGGEAFPKEREVYTSATDTSASAGDHSPLLGRGVGGEAGGSAFITRFREAVERRMEDSELSVEDLAAGMNLSRVQLYRKVKSLTGSSPVELLRTARLSRAYQLLLTTDKNVSEVAYAVGFTAPAYFTKCFKDEYGMVPGDVRKT